MPDDDIFAAGDNNAGTTLANNARMMLGPRRAHARQYAGIATALC